MLRSIVNSSARSLPLAAAALLIHIGTAAAATSPDFQTEVSAVLAGNIAARSSLQTNSTRGEPSGSNNDAQQFARLLLLGWSVSHPGRDRSAAQSGSRTAADVTRRGARAQGDIQSMVRRFLMGKTSAARGAS
ncbi:MAG TPA: hypothetical protein VIC29_04355 [Steroidobacteraceae bacterium]|jgi:hypothetical protein